MEINERTVRTLQCLVTDGKARRPDLSDRIERALVVLLFREWERLDDSFIFISERGDRHYTATEQGCSCPDATYRGGPCKHTLGVRLLRRAEAAASERERADVAALLAHFSEPESFAAAI